MGEAPGLIAAPLPAGLSTGLPRLLYLGDVPVESSYHGSALLFRLLQSYPEDRLRIMEAGTYVSQSERRLRAVKYDDARLPLARLHTTRFAPWYVAACLRSAKWRAAAFAGTVGGWRPEAILTVTHGYSWMTAAVLARRLRLPLHLICHDEWVPIDADGQFRPWHDEVFGEIYRGAFSRLCVSPFMERAYAERYGVNGTVLYPSRAGDAAKYTAPAERMGSGSDGITCVFAGTINSPGMVAALKLVARCLLGLGGRLLVFGPLDKNAAKTAGLDAPNIEHGGLLSPARLMQELRQRADVLFVPMSFASADRPNMEISFPSKLTDYTAVGVPLLIFGPDYCSAVRWARANGGVAEVVTEESEGAMSAALSRLTADPDYRWSLAQSALEFGDHYFSARAASDTFHAALRSAGVGAIG